jgi:hypothetical protein
VFVNNSLNLILQTELRMGNAVVEDTSWLPKCIKLIILKCPFNGKYDEFTDVKYSEMNDPHYWMAEYGTFDNSECLAFKF